MRKRAREETVSIHRIYDDALQELSQDVTHESVATKLPSLTLCSQASTEPEGGDYLPCLGAMRR